MKNTELIESIKSHRKDRMAYLQNVGERAFPEDVYLVSEYELRSLSDPDLELLEALKITLKAMLNLSRQIPTNETLADFNFDLCEIAKEKALKAIKKATS